jgi:hypothetical protein
MEDSRNDRQSRTKQLIPQKSKHQSMRDPKINFRAMLTLVYTKAETGYTETA